MDADRSNARVREQGHTYEDYWAIPEEQGRYELLDGELVAMSPGPNLPHQASSHFLQQYLDKCEDEYLVLCAPLDVYLSDYSVLQPDIILIHRSRTELLSFRGIEGPPDLVVEILSPSTAARDRGKKMDIYTHYGVREYWIVDMGNSMLEQYLQRDGRLALNDVYSGDKAVTSPNMPCISFTMNGIAAKMPVIGAGDSASRAEDG